MLETDGHEIALVTVLDFYKKKSIRWTEYVSKSGVTVKFPLTMALNVFITNPNDRYVSYHLP